MALTDPHKTEISALNALVQLINNLGGGGGAGGATETTLQDVLSELEALNNDIPAIGQTDSANSTPVVIATDQTEIPVIITSAAPLTIQTSALPSGASTSAMQTTQNNNLNTIATNTGTTATNTSSSATSLQTIVSNTGIIATDSDIIFTGQGGQTAVGQNILLQTAGTGAQSVVSSRAISVQIVPVGTITSGVISFEGTNDNVTWTPIFLYDDASASTNPVSSYTPTTGVNRFFSGPTHFSFIRFRISTVIGGGGSVQAYTITRRQPFQPNVYTISQATAANLNATVTGTVTTNGTIFAFSPLGTNSTTTQLAAGATFTGIIESIVNQQSYSILFFSDQNSIITIKQYIDLAGTKLISSLSYTYTAGSTNFARSGVANGNYLQVTVQNTGGSTTTMLQLDTAYGTIPAATPLNNAPIAINEINGTVVSTGIGASDAGTQRNALVNEQVQDLYFTGQATQTATIQNIIPSTSSVNATDVTGFSSGSIQIVSTGTGGTFIFEGANDSATSANYVTIPVWNATVQSGTPIQAAITATSSAILYVFPINYRYIRVRIATTITGGSIQAFTTIKRANFTGSALQIAQATANNLNMTLGGGTVTTLSNTTQLTPGVAATNLGKAEDAVAASGDTGVFALGVRRDTLTTSSSATGDYNEMSVDKYGNMLIKDQTRHKRTYSLAFTVAPAATATDIFQIIGSATTTVSINKINISGTQTTGGQTTISLIKRSTANTGGTSTSSTMVVHDLADAAATAVGSIYTANPTTGTPVGNIRIFSLPLGAVTSTTNNIVQVDFGERGKPIVLNGVAQAMVIALGGVTLTGGSINVWIEFTEE